MQHRWRTGGCWSRNTLVRGKQRGQKLNTYRDVPLLQQETNVFHMLWGILLSFYMCLHQRASSKIYLTLAVVSWFWRVIAFSDCICKSNWRRMLIYDATAHLSNKYYTCSHQRFLEDAMHMRHYKCFSEDSVALHKNGYVVHCCAGLCGRGWNYESYLTARCRFIPAQNENEARRPGKVSYKDNKYVPEHQLSQVEMFTKAS